MFNRKGRSHARHGPYLSPSVRSTPLVLEKAQSQTGFRKYLILLQIPGVDSPFIILKNAVEYIGSTLQFNCERKSEIIKDKIHLREYNLSIDGEVLAEGNYSSDSDAKNDLASIAIEKLQKTCFTLIKKFHPRHTPQINFIPPCVQGEGLTPSELPEIVANLPESSMRGGIGEKIMQKMGWSGAGLGAQEQGCCDIVSDYIQINRQGLGSKNIMQEVTKILRNHAASGTLNAIAFSTDFSKEERIYIHQAARKLNLKSKSYGAVDKRILVVQKKMHLLELVRSLLEVKGENEQYQLLSPTDFNT